VAIESWIDQIAKAFEIDDGRGGTVLSYRVFERAEFPESLSDFPCALTYPTGVTSQYSVSGPAIDLWTGQTEFHITPNVDKSSFPQVIKYIARIRNAAAQNIRLNSTVEHFLLRVTDVSIQGPVELRYGSDEPHLGLMVYWIVKENVSGDFTVSA